MFSCPSVLSGACCSGVMEPARNVEQPEGQWPPRKDVPSQVWSLQGSFDDLSLESYICRCYRGQVVWQLPHDCSFPLSPQTAFPNHEIIKELSTNFRFTSSGALPPFLPGACYPNALLRHSSYSEAAGYREVEICPSSSLGPVRTRQCSQRPALADMNTGNRTVRGYRVAGWGQGIAGRKINLLPSSSNSL